MTNIPRTPRPISQCIGHFLRPIINILLFVVFVIGAAYLLPFVNVNYSMQVVSLETILLHKAEGTPIPVNTETISIPVYLYGLCGVSQTLEQIKDNRKILAEAGNHKETANVDERIRNRLHYIPRTGLIQIDRNICGEEDPMSNDFQLATYKGAGLVIIVLLIFASALSVLCIAIHSITVLWRVRIEIKDEMNLYTASAAVDVLSEAIAWISFFASLIYTCFTWTERKGSGSTYSVGYYVFGVVSMAMFFRWVPVAEYFISRSKFCRREQTKKSPPAESLEQLRHRLANENIV